MGLINFLLNKYVLLVVGFVIMFIGLMPEYTLKAVRMIGMMGWAESSIGQGGTFTVWKIIGIIAPILAILYFFTPSMQIQFGSQPTQDATQYNAPVDSYYQ